MGVLAMAFARIVAAEAQALLNRCDDAGHHEAIKESRAGFRAETVARGVRSRLEWGDCRLCGSTLCMRAEEGAPELVIEEHSQPWRTTAEAAAELRCGGRP